MQEFFNPAGLDVVEDRRGAIAYGFIAARVLYGRFVGALSGRLASEYIARVTSMTGASRIAYFADFSALTGYEPAARLGLFRFVLDRRDSLLSITLLGDATDVATLAARVGEPDVMVEDPKEFERLLTNVASPGVQRSRILSELPEVHRRITRSAGRLRPVAPP